MRDIRHYILNAAGVPVEEPDFMKWAMWLETAKRTVGCTAAGGVTVSTVFLGLDHNFGSKGPPVLWETAVITNGKHLNSPQEWDITERCSGSREQAEAMHARLVAKHLTHDGIKPTASN